MPAILSGTFPRQTLYMDTRYRIQFLHRIGNAKCKQLEIVAQWLYCIIAPTLKLAVLWLYRRIFGPQTRINYMVNGGIVFNVIAYTALFFISLLSCMPLERRWNPFVEGYCLPSGVNAYLSGAINTLTDGFVVLLPIPVIWKINMAFSSKIRASAVFSLGIMYYKKIERLCCYQLTKISAF